MVRHYVRVTSKRKAAINEMRALNRSFSSRGIKRVAYVTPVSSSYVRKLTIKGYPIAKRNYGIAIRNK